MHFLDWRSIVIKEPKGWRNWTQQQYIACRCGRNDGTVHGYKVWCEVDGANRNS